MCWGSVHPQAEGCGHGPRQPAEFVCSSFLGRAVEAGNPGVFREAQYPADRKKLEGMGFP